MMPFIENQRDPRKLRRTSPDQRSPVTLDCKQIPVRYRPGQAMIRIIAKISHHHTHRIRQSLNRRIYRLLRLRLHNPHASYRHRPGGIEQRVKLNLGRLLSINGMYHPGYLQILKYYLPRRHRDSENYFFSVLPCLCGKIPVQLQSLPSSFLAVLQLLPSMNSTFSRCCCR
jgi:hypothetical protein